MGPTIYAEVEESRVRELQERTAEAVSSELGALERELHARADFSIKEAYRRGVIDGFAQGVAERVDQQPRP